MNSKAVAGRERKAEAEAAKDRAAAAAQEAADAEAWKVGSNARGAGRDAAKAQKDADKASADAAKRAALAEEEEATSGIKTKKAPKAKKGDDVGALLAAGLSGQKKSKASAAASKAKDGKAAPAGKAPSGIRIAQQAAAQAVDGAPTKKDKGIVFGGEDDLMMAGNMNRVSLEEGTEEATSIEGAINLLDGGGGVIAGGSGPPLKEDSKNRKALYMAYKERMMPVVKEENPGLRLRQYEDRIFEMWKKAPENPANRDLAREAAVPP